MWLFSPTFCLSDSFVTPQTVACQVSLSTGFPRQEYWGGLPFPSLGDLSDPGIKPVSPALAGRFFTMGLQRVRHDLAIEYIAHTLIHTPIYMLFFFFSRTQNKILKSSIWEQREGEWTPLVVVAHLVTPHTRFGLWGPLEDPRALWNTIWNCHVIDGEMRPPGVRCLSPHS